MSFNVEAHNNSVDDRRNREARERGFEDWTEWKNYEDVYQQTIEKRSDIGKTVL